MRFVVTGALIALTFASPANAHWQWSKWGMSIDQLLAASGGTATAGSGELSAQGDVTKGATGTYVSGDYNFRVNYWFRGQGLSTVSLMLDDDQKCLNLQRDLLAKYGQPVESGRGSVARSMWIDDKGGNRVVLITTNLNYCELQYSARVDPSGSGL